jgi:hypothetical protein
VGPHAHTQTHREKRGRAERERSVNGLFFERTHLLLKRPPLCSLNISLCFSAVIIERAKAQLSAKREQKGA